MPKSSSDLNRLGNSTDEFAEYVSELGGWRNRQKKQPRPAATNRRARFERLSRTGSGVHLLSAQFQRLNHRCRLWQALLMSDCQAVDGDFAVGCGRVTLAGIGLGVTAGFEITAGSADAVGVDVLAVIVTFHPAVSGDKLDGEDGSQLVISSQDRSIIAVLVNEQFRTLQAEN